MFRIDEGELEEFEVSPGTTEAQPVNRKGKRVYVRHVPMETLGLDPDDDFFLDTGQEETATVETEVGFETVDERRFNWRKFWAFSGPGFLMSLAFLDPGNLESDLQLGAVAGYRLLWVLLYSTVVGGVFQLLSAKLGVVSGRHLAELCRFEYDKWTKNALWIATELAIVGSDVQEVVGSAVALNILFKFPLWLGVIVTALDTFTFMFLHQKGVRKLEALFFALISCLTICFFVEFAIGKPDIAGVLRGTVVPTLPKNTYVQAVGIFCIHYVLNLFSFVSPLPLYPLPLLPFYPCPTLPPAPFYSLGAGMVGAVIMPHNLFLHSALVQSRRVDRTRGSKLREATFYFSLESIIALVLSFLVNAAVVSVFAKGFFYDPLPGHEDSTIGLHTAGDLLRERFGQTAQIIWALGLLAAGQASTMTGTFAGQYVMHGFLQLRLPPWKRVILTRGVALVPALAVALAFQNQLDKVDEWINVLQSLQLPFALLPLLSFCCNKRVLGDMVLEGTSKRLMQLSAALVLCINAYLVLEFVDTSNPWLISLAVLLGTTYFTFCAHVAGFFSLIDRCRRRAYTRMSTS
ncbi:MAG: hypothetical protein MHM6MM_000010 [Cercozoa sp. M6MM]